MFDDSDIKIVGDKPSETVKKHIGDYTFALLPKELVEAANTLGKNLADIFLKNIDSVFVDDNTDSQMLVQRRLLLSFTVNAVLDEHCINDTVSGIAVKSFLDTLAKKSPLIYESCNDTGAFSFYYLAYRRRTDVERRIGQTFAMLCAHDGDPIYQELGEALYCWFVSVVKGEIEKLQLDK
ncbi:MAG: hypothetical protein IJA13_04320 [Clostridia bacterium]|nr:hypothetical protein [Clostridia bacterium]